MPLSFAPLGKELTVIKVSVDEKTKRHLENLGILIGGNITTVSESSGNLILKIKEGRLAINKDLAMKIFVR